MVQPTILGVMHRDLELLRGPKLLAVKVFIDDLIRGIPEVQAVERHSHDEEAGTEHRLSLGEFDLTLVRAVWCANFSQVGDETI